MLQRAATAGTEVPAAWGNPAEDGFFRLLDGVLYLPAAGAAVASPTVIVWAVLLPVATS